MDVLWNITFSRFFEELLAIHNCEDEHYAQLLAKKKEYESIFGDSCHSMNTDIGQFFEVIEEIRIIENEVIYMRGLKDGAKASKVMGI